MVETFVQSTDDVVRFLKDQHNLIKDMFEEVFSASSDEARGKAFTELRQLLAVHETAEEMVVHPRARQEVDGGDEVVDARPFEHRAAQDNERVAQRDEVGDRDHGGRHRLDREDEAGQHHRRDHVEHRGLLGLVLRARHE